MSKIGQSIKKSLPKYLAELIIVAFGVFLGILVSEHKTKNKIKENASISRAYIIDELETNRQNLINIVQYHEKIKKGFDSLKSQITEEITFSTYFSNNKFRQEHIPGWNGLGIVKIEDVAFESAKIGGIFQSMDINDVKQISSAYRQLYNYREFGNIVTEKTFSMNAQTIVMDVVGILDILTSDFLNNEKHLVNELDQTIKILKE